MPEFAKHLQTVYPSEPTHAASDNQTSTSSQPQPSIQTSDSFVLDEISNHYKGELPGFKPNSEKASETEPSSNVLERPQQRKPNSQMATNTCTELAIHSDYKPYHLSATHSNISFAIALRNLANKQSCIFEPIQPVSQDTASSVIQIVNQEHLI